MSRILKELVTDHDMVGLPGIGTFVTEVVPASFSDKGYTINPPYRRLSFVQGRIEDQLLIEFYAESNEVSVEAAEAYITQFLREMKEVLKERKIILLPGLGRLRATKENNFFFVPEEDLDIFPDGFALKPVSLKNIQREMEPVTIPVSFAEAVQGLMEKKQAEAEPEPEPSPATEPELKQPLRELVPLDPEQVPYSGADIPLDPQAMQEPEPESEPEAQPQPEPEPEAQPEQQPEPEPEPQPEQAQAEPEQQPDQEPTPEPEQVQVDPEPTAEPEQQPQAEPEQAKPEPGQQTRPRRRWWIAVLVVVALLAVALGVFIILAHAAPDFIDSILYTPEELRIINA